MAQAALCDMTPQTRIPTLLIVFCVHVVLLVGRCEFRPNDLAVHVPPTDLEPTFHVVTADANPTPKPAPANKKAKSKTTAKTGAKGQTEQTTLTQMDLEARVDVQSIDKAQQQAIAAQIEAANNAGSGGRGAPGLKCKPKAQAVTIASMAQLEQASQRTRSAKH